MRQINIHAAKTHLSRLVDEAVKGDSFVICKAGKPMVMVVPVAEKASTPEQLREALLKKRFGFMAGAYSVPENYWEVDKKIDQEMEEIFYGKEL